MADSTTSAAPAVAVHHRDSPAAPPPTPSNHQAPLPSSTDAALSTLLHQVLLLSTSAPALSSPPLRRRRSPPSLNPRSDESHKTIPTISLKYSEEKFSSELLSAAENHGFFHLSDHSIPSEIHRDALLETQSVMISSKQASSITKYTSSLKEEDYNNNSRANEGFVVLDASNNKLIDEFPALQDFVQNLMKTGMEVVKKLMVAAGYADKTRAEEGLNLRGLLWISKSNEEEEDGDDEEQRKLRTNPYVLSLRYNDGPSWLVVGDSGEQIRVAGGEGSILVTVGDVLQEWSNGKFKKVRGIPKPEPTGRCKSPGNISISLLIALPVDSMIYPLPVPQEADGNEDDADHKFSAFSFDEHARRIYHA